MVYEDFVKRLSEIDKSNKFEISKVKNNPYDKFYDLYNPKGVEFEFNYGTVFMIPYDKIEKVTKEYKHLNADYVFAVSDGDPYFVKNKKVYTCCHGTKEPELEFISNSFEDFLKKVMKGVM